ncbi:hypothetical protein BGZ88_011368 [Linnemannia elongata]|nr:hypothetical protein BGZ88_011368 [Linnemannia elongata]
MGSIGGVHSPDRTCTYWIRTRIWTQERGVGPNDNRADMTCSIAGDHFVVWGGMLPKTAHFAEETSGTPLIFNLRSKRWATQFVRDRKVATSALSKRSPSDDIGVILGVIEGIVALIILYCFLTALRWRMKEQSERRLKAMEGLQQKVPQYNTHNNEPVDLISWSADKMEIQGDLARSEFEYHVTFCDTLSPANRRLFWQLGEY